MKPALQVVKSELPKLRQGQHGAMKPRPPGTLKQAIQRSFESLGANYGERAAYILGLGTSQVHRYADPEHRSVYPRVDHLRQLHNAGASTDVLEYLAAEANCVLVPLSLPNATADLAREVARVGEAFGRVWSAWGEGLGDNVSPGVIDGREAGVMLDQLDQMLGQAAALRAALVARRDEP